MTDNPHRSLARDAKARALLPVLYRLAGVHRDETGAAEATIQLALSLTPEQWELAGRVAGLKSPPSQETIDGHVLKMLDEDKRAAELLKEIA